MNTIDRIKEVIRDKVNNAVDWANPYWLDEIKEEYESIPETEIDEIYATEMKNKVSSLSKAVAQTILDEQNSLTSANQNYFLANLLEEKLGLAP